MIDTAIVKEVIEQEAVRCLTLIGESMGKQGLWEEFGEDAVRAVSAVMLALVLYRAEDETPHDEIAKLINRILAHYEDVHYRVQYRVHAAAA